MTLKGISLNLYFTLAIIFLLISCKTETKKGIQNKKPYLVILSMDGFRWDYPEKANTPTLDSLEKNGVRANLIPSFPTKTFPNHYSIATGLYPDKHGIIFNNFYNYELDLPYSMSNKAAMYNPDFYDGEPIWNTAEKQGITTASYYWVGSETAIQGKHQTYWKKYNHYFPFENIIDTVVHWLDLPEEKRPHFVSFYFNEPDETGHEFGPNSNEIIKNIEYLDSLLGVFFTKINKLPIANQLNVIVTSDHGMGEISREKTIIIDDFIRSEWVQKYYGGSPVFLLKAKEGFKDSVYNNLKKAEHCAVYYPNEIPERLHFGTNLNIKDIVILADSSWSIAWKKNKHHDGFGSHGYDNKNSDMHAIFYAVGPVFKENYQQKSFENINIYPLLAEILKINPAETDGNLEEVNGMLKNQ